MLWRCCPWSGAQKTVVNLMRHIMFVPDLWKEQLRQVQAVTGRVVG